MKKIISAVLALFIFIGSGSAFTFSELNSFFEYSPPSDGGSGDGGSSNGGGSGGGDNAPTLVVPAYKDYGRGTIDFENIVYLRPDIDAAVEAFNRVSEQVKINEISFAEQLEAIKQTDDLYFEISAMYSYANIMTSRDSTSQKWSEEYEYISVNYPKFAQAVEKLFVSCAASPHAESFETEYFGDGLVEKYLDGGSYSDAAVALMAAEAELESEYSKLNTSTVIISHDGKEKSAQYFLDYYYEKYADSPYAENTYLYYVTLITSLYYQEYAELAKPIYIDLLKIRRLIADELGLQSYTEYAYEAFGHDYTPAEMLGLLEEIGEYVMPLFAKLYRDVFSGYAIPDGIRNIHENDIINTLYYAFTAMDGDLAEAYSYMLQHGLYDIKGDGTSRYDGAFTVYIDTYNAPFIFVSTAGNITDAFTVAHEFGHFFDNFVNYGSSSSLDLAEVSSQALELLSLSGLDTVLREEIVDYLLVLKISELLGTLRTQGLYAMFEHKAYELDYDEITEEKLSEILAECEQTFAYPENTFSLGDILLVPHVVLYPEYVQAYCTSALVSLEIFFTEQKSSGAGLAAYKELVSRGEDSSFKTDLASIGLASPFDAGFIKNMVDEIHLLLCGTKYFKTNDSTNAA